MKRRSTLFLSLLLVLALPAAARRRAVSPRELYPPCSMVTGSSAVTFTRNDGFTLIPFAVPPQPIAYTYGLASMIDEVDTLVAWHGDDLLISTNAGCSWRVAATVEGADFPPKLEPARGGRVYAWSENRLFFVRYDSRGAVLLRQPVEFVGLAADATNADRVRAGGTDGTLWESVDAGETWTQLGTKIDAPFAYRFAFDPHDLDHIAVGTVTNGAYLSRDGGRTWTHATGFGKSSANVFHLAFSPVDGNRVWAFAIDLEQSNTGHPSHGRHIYQSDDGGSTFREVVDEAPGVKLVNGPTMAPHPTDRDVLYFIFGTHFQDYGTDLFRYNAASAQLSMTHSDLDDVNAIAFSRKNPSVMYLGIEAMN
ncbi:MAG TPA: dispase autolysis-inducing protein [Thermoanaerobaculia bacterium]|nr:dispase autolysis-inducing protein [Thermoanaerobaculia bacterium]